MNTIHIIGGIDMNRLTKGLLAPIFALSAAFIMGISVSAQEVTDGSWVYSEEGTRFVRENGSFVTGWVSDTAGNRFYFCKDGTRAENKTMIIKDEIYRFDERGRVITDEVDVQSITSAFEGYDFAAHCTVTLGQRGQANAKLIGHGPLTYEADAVIGQGIDGSVYSAKVFSSYDNNGYLFAWGMLIPLEGGGKEVFNGTVSSFKEMYSDYGDYTEDDNSITFIIDNTVLYMSCEDDDSMFVFTYDNALWPDYLDVSDMTE